PTARLLTSAIFPYATLFRSHSNSVPERRHDVPDWFAGPAEHAAPRLPDLFQSRGQLLMRGLAIRALLFLVVLAIAMGTPAAQEIDRKSTRLNSSHSSISYAV